MTSRSFRNSLKNSSVSQDSEGLCKLQSTCVHAPLPLPPFLTKTVQKMQLLLLAGCDLVVCVQGSHPEPWEWTCLLCDALVLNLPTINQRVVCLALRCHSRKRHSEHSDADCKCSILWGLCKSEPQDYINSHLLPVWNSASRMVWKLSAFLRMRSFPCLHLLCYSATLSSHKTSFSWASASWDCRKDKPNGLTN